MLRHVLGLIVVHDQVGVAAAVLTAVTRARRLAFLLRSMRRRLVQRVVAVTILPGFDPGPAVSSHLTGLDAELGRHVGTVAEAVGGQGLAVLRLRVAALAEVGTDAGDDDGRKLQRVVVHAQPIDPTADLGLIAFTLRVAAVISKRRVGLQGGSTVAANEEQD